MTFLGRRRRRYQRELMFMLHVFAHHLLLLALSLGWEKVQIESFYLFHRARALCTVHNWRLAFRRKLWFKCCDIILDKQLDLSFRKRTLPGGERWSLQENINLIKFLKLVFYQIEKLFSWKLIQRLQFNQFKYENFATQTCIHVHVTCRSSLKF